MMDYRRGWCPMELAYSDLVQSNFLHPGGSLLNFELPLFFLNRTDVELPRTVWDALRDREEVSICTPMATSVAWAVEQITAFLRREQDIALDMMKVVVPGQPVYDTLAGPTWTNRKGHTI